MINIDQLARDARLSLQKYPFGIPTDARRTLLTHHQRLFEVDERFISDVVAAKRQHAEKPYGFTGKEIAGTFEKPAQGTAFAINRFEEGHFGRFDPGGKRWLTTAVFGKTALNYAVGENIFGPGLRNCILGGIPVMYFATTTETAAVDRLMFERFMELAENDIPDGVIIKLLTFESHDQFGDLLSELDRCASVFFIGSRSAAEKIKSRMRSPKGSFLTGRSNGAFVFRGREELAGTQLGEAMAKRMNVTCSAPSDVYVHADANAQTFVDAFFAAATTACRARDKQAIRELGGIRPPLPRFRTSLRNDVAAAVAAGFTKEVVKVHESLSERDEPSINPIILRGNVSRSTPENGELFGRALRVFEGFTGDRVGDLVPLGKTGIVFGDIQDLDAATSLLPDGAWVDVQRSYARWTLNELNGTPVGREAVHCNRDGLEEMHSTDDVEALLYRNQQ